MLILRQPVRCDSSKELLVESTRAPLLELLSGEFNVFYELHSLDSECVKEPKQHCRYWEGLLSHALMILLRMPPVVVRHHEGFEGWRRGLQDY